MTSLWKHSIFAVLVCKEPHLDVRMFTEVENNLSHATLIASLQRNHLAIFESIGKQT